VRALQLGILVATGAGLRLWVLFGARRLSADEAIPGLMARHILYAHELPVFYWGQTYFGALESYLLAATFALLGFHPWLLFVPPMLASIALIPLTWILAEYLGPPPAGVIAALPVAITPPILGRLLVNAGGGFALGCALQLTTLLLVMRGLRASSLRFGTLALVGLAGGAAAWVWQPALLTLPLVLAILFASVDQFRSTRGLACVTPVLFGLLPMLVYNVAADWPTATALLRKFDEQSVPVAGLAAQLQQFGSVTFSALGGGDESYGGSNPVQAAVLAAALVVGPFVILYTGWRQQRATSLTVLLVATGIGVVVAHGGARYLVGLFVAAAALCGATFGTLITHAPRTGYALAMVWLLLCAAPNLAPYASAGVGLPPDQLSELDQTSAAVEALRQRGLTTGYADYWAAYPIAYVSGERVLVAPSLPPMYSGKLDRYPAYTAQVDAEDVPERVFLLVDARCAAQPYLDSLASSGATYRADPVARWLLIWDIQPAAGAGAHTLEALRTAIAAQQTC
jgi:hypothetical protein